MKKRYKSAGMILLCIFLISQSGISVIAGSFAPLPSNNASITIDGYSDDWEDKPYTDVYYWTGAIHKVSLFMEGDYAYFRITMSENMEFNNNAIFLTVNNTVLNTAICLGDDRYPSFNNVSTGINNVQLVYQEGSFEDRAVLGTGILMKTDRGSSDFCELAIPLAVFNNISGVDLGGVPIEQISTYLPNLGSQTIACAGSSSGPYLIAGVGLVIAGLTLLTIRRKNRV